MGSLYVLSYEIDPQKKWYFGRKLVLYSDSIDEDAHALSYTMIFGGFGKQVLNI